VRLEFPAKCQIIVAEILACLYIPKILALFLKMDHVLLQACYFCCVLQTFLPSFAKICWPNSNFGGGFIFFLISPQTLGK